MTSATWTDTLQYLASFALVIALLLGVLFALRKLQMTQAFGRKSARLQVVETLPLGTRHKIALVRCDEQEILVGITANEITALGQWPARPPQDGQDKQP